MGKNLVKALQRKRCRAEAKDAADELVLERWAQFCKKADLSLLYTLNTFFGFGKIRLMRFYKAWVKNQLEMAKRFRDDKDDVHYWAQESRLRQRGIYIEDFLKVADEIEREFNEVKNE